jgi:hypothetical protein
MRIERNKRLAKTVAKFSLDIHAIRLWGKSFTQRRNR